MSELQFVRYEGPEEGPAVILVEHDRFQASISEVGATVTSWQPGGEKAVLFTSPEAKNELGHAVRGGVPICWPWFGPSVMGDGLPQHGLVRTREWHLVEANEDEQEVRLKFKTADDEGLPEGIELDYEVILAETLRLRLSTTNSSDDPFSYSQALHSYFAIGDLTKARVRGLDDCAFEDALAGYVRRVQRGVLDLEDAIDAVFYTLGGEIELEDPVWERRLRLVPEGSHSLVVWNPGKQGASSVSDLRPEDYRNFICLEVANARQNDQVLPPGHSHTLGVGVSIEKCC